MELNIAAHADNLHTGAQTTPVFNDFVLVLKVFLSAQLAVRLESREFALFAHVILKAVVCEASLAQRALELFAVEPCHHDVVHFGVKAFRLRA